MASVDLFAAQSSESAWSWARNRRRFSRHHLCRSPMTSSEPPLPTLLGFVADESKEFEGALVRDRADVALWNQIQGFYEGALAQVHVHENEIPIFQLLTFSHYYFLTATAAMMRCHLSEAFGSTRIAIDAALIGAHIISDRASQIAYARREKPFDNFARHIGNLIAAKKALPHPLVPSRRVEGGPRSREHRA
jgi:hypothetical protein